MNARLDKELVSDFDRLATIIAEETPAWEAGTRQAYHAVTLGFYEGELIRRVDPKHRSWDSSSMTKSQPLWGSTFTFICHRKSPIQNSRL